MSTQAKSPYFLKAQFLGPVFSLSAQLANTNQNLIFARNGTGKSFLSRAFRYLDMHGLGKDISDASHSLISEESTDGKGSFALSQGSTVLGELQLENSSVRASLADTIFHVFSEDFVQQELRERQFEIDGTIENQIAVDQDDIKKQEITVAIKSIEDKLGDATRSLHTLLEAEKSKQLQKRAAVSHNLKEYSDLTAQRLIQQYTSRPDSAEIFLAELVRDLDTLKAIPLEPQYPDQLSSISNADLGIDTLRLSLLRITTPSSVSEAIKARIEQHHTFYEVGTGLLKEKHGQECPFCDQPISRDAARNLLDAYVAYFNDEEETHKSELRSLFRELSQKEKEIDSLDKALSRQSQRYDDLKRYIPSMRDTIISPGNFALKDIRFAISSIKSIILQKVATLSVAIDLNSEPLQVALKALNDNIEANNAKVSELKRAVERADSERKSLQRRACTAFENEFVRRHWNEFDNLARLEGILKQNESALSELEKLTPSQNARERVSDTFELLLSSFFGSKYTFDRTAFVLTRNGIEMKRGAHRTLSDGEKTVLAFCYFVACLHRKVRSNKDYSKLFLIFDDPVTSMSYDYIFSIAQILKDLTISNTGHISVNPHDKASSPKPRILILTHSTYLYNICRSNNVVNTDATFCLEVKQGKHTLTRQKIYVAPFEQQLSHIYAVSNGEDPDHSTGNCVRSVLEAIGRFCRPDKATDMGSFVTYLAGECEIRVQSVLINSLSHGTYYDETPTSDDIRIACREVIEVVKKFAVGQLEMIAKSGKAP